jgi:Tfp pilus assembly protein PilF
MKDLVNQSPTSAPANAQMGTLMLLKRNQAAALRYFTRANQLDPSLVEPLTGLVTIDVAERRYSDARTRSKNRCARTRAIPERLLLAAGVYTITGDTSTAERTLKTLVEVDPSNLRHTASSRCSTTSKTACRKRSWNSKSSPTGSARRSLQRRCSA